MSDEIDELLIQALCFLEMGFGAETKEDAAHHADLMWAAHEHVQRAWGLYRQQDAPHKISKNTRILVSTFHALTAIANAADKND